MTENVTTPSVTTSGMVRIPVMARGSTPSGTGTSNRVVSTAVVDIVPGTGASSAEAGIGPRTAQPAARAGSSQAEATHG